MTVRRFSVDDLDWAVDRLAWRRARLVPYAPLYWRPAPDAGQAHRRYLGYVVGEGGGIGFRTDDALMIAAPGRGGGWTIDDAVIPDGGWADTGQQLWNALARQIAVSSVRFVCPTPEAERGHFAQEQGLQIQTSWWQVTVDQIRPPLDGEQPHIDGATATLVRAPRIYDPGGPILFVTEVNDAGRALPSARIEAERLGSPIIVVDQRPADSKLDLLLGNAGFYRHCDFFAGTVKWTSTYQ